MMRENLDQWDFVILAYAVTAIGVAWLLVASYRLMRRAEDKRRNARGE